MDAEGGGFCREEQGKGPQRHRKLHPTGGHALEPALQAGDVIAAHRRKSNCGMLLHIGRTSLWFACLCEQLDNLREPLGQVPAALVGEEQGAPVLLSQNLPVDPVPAEAEGLCPRDGGLLEGEGGGELTVIAVPGQGGLFQSLQERAVGSMK